MYKQFFISLEKVIKDNTTRLENVSDSLNVLYEMYKWYTDIYRNNSQTLVTVKQIKNDIDTILAICYRLDLKNDATSILITCTLDFIEKRLEDSFFIVYRSIDLICNELENESIKIRNIILEEMRDCGLNISQNEFDLFDWVTPPTDVEKPSVDDIIDNKPVHLPSFPDKDPVNLPSFPDIDGSDNETDVDVDKPTDEPDDEENEPVINPDTDGSNPTEDTPTVLPSFPDEDIPTPLK